MIPSKFIVNRSNAPAWNGVSWTLQRPVQFNAKARLPGNIPESGASLPGWKSIRHACIQPAAFFRDTGRWSVPALRSTLERRNDQGLTICFQLPRTYECALAIITDRIEKCNFQTVVVGFKR